MTKQAEAQLRPLCPHLAAASLWMSKTSRTTRRGTLRIRFAPNFGQAMDDALAL